MRAALAAGIALCLSGFAVSAAEQGCDQFAWNLEEERSLLAAAGVPAADRPPMAMKLALRPIAEAGLPKPPERAPRTGGTMAGHLSFSAAEAGLYRVTLSSEAWLDVVQEGAYRPAEAFTGAQGCPGIRKSVRFRLEPGTAIVQISSSQSEVMSVAVTRDR